MFQRAVRADNGRNEGLACGRLPCEPQINILARAAKPLNNSLLIMPYPVFS